MSRLTPECDELRISLERLRGMLDGLVVRGLRACGPDQMGQLESFIEQLEHVGAGHVGAMLEDLREKISKDDRNAARALLEAQTSVRMLERLLTLRVVRGQFQIALAMMDADAAAPGDDQEEE